MTGHIHPPYPRSVMRIIDSRAYRNLHRGLFRISGGRIGRRINHMDTVLVTTIGRRSGREHTVPLLSLRDGEALVVVASNGGSESYPSWWHNIQAHPRVVVASGEGRRPMRARCAAPAEEERMWSRLVAANQLYAYYSRVAKRPIPLVYLEPAGDG